MSVSTLSVSPKSTPAYLNKPLNTASVMSPFNIRKIKWEEGGTAVSGLFLANQSWHVALPMLLARNLKVRASSD